MGKNQAYKAMQKARVGSSSAGPLEVEDGMVDGSFHSPEWHAARLASLKTSHTITWEEFKKKQKEDELRKGEMEADTDRSMRAYRAQLDAERAQKLSHGRNWPSSKSKDKKDRKDRDSKKPSSKRRKVVKFDYKVISLLESILYFICTYHRCSVYLQHSKRKPCGSSSSESSSDLSSSEGEERESRRSKSRSKRTKKEKKQRSKPSDGEEHDGPVPLSRFFESVKS